MTLNSDSKECSNRIFVDLQTDTGREAMRERERERENYVKHRAHFSGHSSTNRIDCGPDPCGRN